MSRDVSIKTIEERITASAPGTVFITSDFIDVASSDTANRTLQRLGKAGFIRRVMRGIYEFPEYSDFLKEYVAPSPDKVAHALARNFGWTIVPSGDTALNRMGLSTQVPATWLYVSDGPYKEYSYGAVTLNFKHTSNKELARISYKTALTIQALKAFGQDRITDGITQNIASVLTKEEKQTMLAEAKYTTAWIYDAIKRICK